MFNLIITYNLFNINNIKLYYAPPLDWYFVILSSKYVGLQFPVSFADHLAHLQGTKY